MVGGRFKKKLTCLLSPAHTVEPGTSSLVGPKRQGKLVSSRQIFSSLIFSSFSPRVICYARFVKSRFYKFRHRFYKIGSPGFYKIRYKGCQNCPTFLICRTNPVAVATKLLNLSESLDMLLRYALLLCWCSACLHGRSISTLPIQARRFLVDPSCVGDDWNSEKTSADPTEKSIPGSDGHSARSSSA